jgi:methyl-accepting chemotaxis protein
MKAFNTLMDNFQSGLKEVFSYLSTVSTASERTVDRATSIRDGSSNQRQSVTEAAVAAEQMTRNIEKIADDTRAAEQLAGDAGSMASAGEQTVRSVTEGMHRIADNVAQSASIIQTLGSRSQEITGIVQVIKDIADQTNLLALNAAIEAARAGEQGRGFAVVADEVRKLAERTSQATIEIGAMIGAIQKDTRSAVSGMETSSGRVDAGVRLAQEAAAALAQIREAANETLAKANEIAQAMDEQNAASSEIARNVERIATMADGNHAAAARTHATVQHIESLAADLSTLTEGLKVAP